MNIALGCEEVVLKRNQTPPAPSNQRENYDTATPTWHRSASSLWDWLTVSSFESQPETEKWTDFSGALSGRPYRRGAKRSAVMMCQRLSTHRISSLSLLCTHQRSTEEDPAEILQSKHTWMLSSTRFPKGPVLKLLLTNKHFHTRPKETTWSGGVDEITCAHLASFICPCYK